MSSCCRFTAGIGWAIVPTDHPLARIRSPLDLNLLAEHPLVTYIYSSRSESTFMKAFNEAGTDAANCLYRA